MSATKGNGSGSREAQPVNTLTKSSINFIANKPILAIIAEALRDLPRKYRTKGIAANLPYCFVRVGDGFVIPLNRRYKPLERESLDFVDYESEEFSRLRIPVAMLDWSYLNDAGFLFKDGNSPLGPYSTTADRASYRTRLLGVMGLGALA